MSLAYNLLTKKICTCEKEPEFTGKAILKKCEEDQSKCLPVSWYCDGKSQCPAGSDEQSCTCEDWGLMECTNKTENIQGMICISKDWHMKNTLACIVDNKTVNVHIHNSQTVEKITISMSKYECSILLNYLHIPALCFVFML